MLKSFLVCVSAAVALSGCHFSKVAADATVTVSGSALDASGAPLAGAQVRVYTEADIADVIFGGVVALGTLGSICLLPDAPTICHKGHTATTDASGRFTLTLKGSDTQGLVGTEATLDAVVAAKDSTAASPSTTLSFTVRDTTVSLPAARLWNAAVKVAEPAGRIRLGWSALPPSYGGNPSYSAQFFIPQQQGALWSQAARGNQADVDARVLEDADATAAAGARTSLTGTGTGSVHANYLSGRITVHASAGAPPSRHRPCDGVVGVATLTTSPQNPCRATDGDLVDPARLSGGGKDPGSVLTGVVIDMGKPVHVGLVVARGISGMNVVEISSDGTHYRQVGILTDSPAALAPPGDPVARYVRVRAPSGLDESLLAEISVWTAGS